MMIMIRLITEWMMTSTDTIQQIVYLIKNQNDYLSAVRLMKQNSLSINELTKRTIKLTQIEIARLADKLIENRS